MTGSGKRKRRKTGKGFYGGEFMGGCDDEEDEEEGYGGAMSYGLGSLLGGRVGEKMRAKTWKHLRRSKNPETRKIARKFKSYKRAKEFCDTVVRGTFAKRKKMYGKNLTYREWIRMATRKMGIPLTEAAHEWSAR